MFFFISPHKPLLPIEPTCAIPDPIPNALASALVPKKSASQLIADQLFAIGDKVKFDCDEGFTLNGPPTIECLEGGTWSQSPICQGFYFSILLMFSPGFCLFSHHSLFLFSFKTLHNVVFCCLSTFVFPSFAVILFYAFYNALDHSVCQSITLLFSFGTVCSMSCPDVQPQLIYPIFSISI